MGRARLAWQTFRLATVLTATACGGQSTRELAEPEDGGNPPSDASPTDIPKRAAVALPNTGLYGGVFLKVSDGPDFTCDAVANVHRCAHWTVVVEMGWELVRVGSIPLKTPPVSPREEAPRITAGSVVNGEPDDSGNCAALAISGTAGELTLEAIDENVIYGRLSMLRAGGEPSLALPTGTIEFQALRCPGNWRLNE